MSAPVGKKTPGAATYSRIQEKSHRWLRIANAAGTVLKTTGQEKPAAVGNVGIRRKNLVQYTHGGLGTKVLRLTRPLNYQHVAFCGNRGL